MCAVWIFQLRKCLTFRNLSLARQSPENLRTSVQKSLSPKSDFLELRTSVQKFLSPKSYFLDLRTSVQKSLIPKSYFLDLRTSVQKSLIFQDFVSPNLDS